MHARCVRWLGLLVLAAPACGSSGGTPFTPTTPVADVCGMLVLSDVQTLMPGATAGAPLTLSDNADVWVRGCAWQGGANGMSVTLLVEGALTSTGKLVLGTAVDGTSNSMRQATAVSGLGDKAVYLNNIQLGNQILNALKGSEVVSVAANTFTPDASEASLESLVVEALGKL